MDDSKLCTYTIGSYLKIIQLPTNKSRVGYWRSRDVHFTLLHQLDSELILRADIDLVEVPEIPIELQKN